jgi:DNA-directed RNA polymerase subunit RPC12/RpoP
MRLKCTGCGTETYSAVARLLVEEGVRCEDCSAELELIERRESLPSARGESRFSRVLLHEAEPEGDSPATSGPLLADYRA